MTVNKQIAKNSNLFLEDRLIPSMIRVKVMLRVVAIVIAVVVMIANQNKTRLTMNKVITVFLIMTRIILVILKCISIRRRIRFRTLIKVKCKKVVQNITISKSHLLNLLGSLTSIVYT